MRHWDQLTSAAYFFARKFDPAVDKEVIAALANRVCPGSAVGLTSLLAPHAGNTPLVQNPQPI
jgi:hypothetical protein